MIRRHVPRILEKVGTEKCLNVLIAALDVHDPDTPREAARSAGRLRERVKVEIDELLVNDGMIRIRGNTDSYGSVDTIEAVIKKNERFAGAEKSDVTKVRDGGTRFMVQSPREPADEEGEG